MYYIQVTYDNQAVGVIKFETLEQFDKAFKEAIEDHFDEELETYRFQIKKANAFDIIHTGGFLVHIILKESGDHLLNLQQTWIYG